MSGHSGVGRCFEPVMFQAAGSDWKHQGALEVLSQRRVAG